MVSARTTSTAESPTPAPARALPDDLDLNSLYELNRAAIEALVEAARYEEPDARLGFIALLRRELRALDPAARKLAAECPFLLIDMGFHEDEWWKSIPRNAHRVLHEPLGSACFPRTATLRLARSTLTLAWYLTRAHPETTPLLLAMSRGCAEVIASLHVSDLESIARRNHHALRPRWEDRPVVWKSLLTAARSGNTEALRAFKLHGVQRIVGELLHRSVER